MGAPPADCRLDKEEERGERAERRTERGEN